MEITATLIKVLEEQKGTSQFGEWTRGTFIVEIEGEYSRKVAFTYYNDKVINRIKQIPVGSAVCVSFVLESREWEGKWYTEAKCYNIEFYVPRSMSFQQGII